MSINLSFIKRGGMIQMNKEKLVTKITIGLILSWFFGIIFFIGFLAGLMVGSYFVAILLFLTACFIIPPIERSIKERWNFEFSTGIKIILVIVGLSLYSCIDFSDTTTQTDTTSNSDNVDEIVTEEVIEEKTTTTSQSKTTTQPAEEQIEIYYLGEPVQIGSFEYTINSYYTTSAIGQDLMGTFMGETADGIFLVVDVTIENTGTQSVTLWDSMIKVVDVQGRTYDHDMNAEIYLSMSNKKAFTFEQLQPGLPKQGYLVFDIPADLKGGFEVSSNSLLSSEKKYITFTERP